MAEFPALPLWTDAYLGDTTHLTTIEHGAYLLLLMAAWRSKDCCLPDDDRLLARYAHLTAGQWMRMRPTLIQFFAVQDGVLRQSRLTAEREVVRQRSMAASNSARAKWRKYKDTPQAVAERTLSERYAPIPIPIDTPIVPKGTKEKKQARLDSLNGHRVEFEALWSAYPRKVGKMDAEKAYLKALSTATAEAIHAGVVRYAIERKGQDPQYTAHPATWLNRKRWLDEPDKPRDSEVRGEAIF